MSEELALQETKAVDTSSIAGGRSIVRGFDGDENSSSSAQVEQVEDQKEDDVVDENSTSASVETSASETESDENLGKTSNEVSQVEKKFKDMKEEVGGFSQEEKERFKELLRDEFLIESLVKARETTIRQTRSILTVFKNHLASDDRLKDRLVKMFGQEAIDEFLNRGVESENDFKSVTRKKDIVFDGIVLNNTSLFIEVSRYLFSPYIQFPQLYKEDVLGNERDPFRTVDVFNYANVVEIEKNTYDDIQNQFSVFENNDRLKALFDLNPVLRGGFDQIKKDAQKMHTYFSIFLLLWNSPFDERDYGVQQYSKNVAMLSEKLSKFMDVLQGLDRLYNDDAFKQKIEHLVGSHLKDVNRKFEEIAGNAIEGAERRINNRVDGFLNRMNVHITNFQKLKREFSMFDDFSDSYIKVANGIESNIGSSYVAKISQSIADLKNDINRSMINGELGSEATQILEAIKGLKASGFSENSSVENEFANKQIIDALNSLNERFSTMERELVNLRADMNLQARNVSENKLDTKPNSVTITTSKKGFWQRLFG
jgi:hypothetical protein